MGDKMLSLWLTWVCFMQSSGLLSHVEQYEVVRPQRLQERQRRSLKENQLYPDKVQYELAIEGRNHTIYLEKNSNLIGRGYTETHYSEYGKRVTTSPSEEHCYYHGHVEGVVDSSVSVGICSGISGFVRARQQVYLIEPLGQSDDGDHAVYRREHLKISGNPSCGSSSNTTMLYDHDQDQNQDRGPQLAGLFRSKAWKTKSVTSVQRFVELYVVVDNTEYKRYGSETKSRILGVINHVDKLYRPLNIRVMLVGLEIWTNRDYINVDLNSEMTLDNFLKWRQDDLLKRIKHDNAQFVTGKDFDKDTVGLANKFAICTENSGGVNQDHHDNAIGLASTIAHEMGHNFGLSHDAVGCMCGPFYSSGNCVMAEKLRTGSQAFPEFFSSCSVDQLAEFMERAQPSCLGKPSPVKTIVVGPRCGNALLDPGEECDCGTVEECKNPCCDASTCRLTEGSQCAHGQCCDNCQFKATGSVCRKSASDCDLPEYCTGVSEDCPEDSFEMNGKPCYDQVQGYCYNGQCPTHEKHCWRLFGPGTIVGPDMCFDLNKRGEEGANCGRNKFGYTPCTAQNLKCGSIFCGGGGESITGKRAAYTVYGIECKLAVDDDKTRNIDMVPKGTKCGANKVCLDNRCVEVSVYGKKEDCAKKCNNNGVCNHKKECHCNPGWAPPYCDIQYADLPPGQTGIIAGVCAALSILLVITVVIAGLMCCKKDNMDNYSSKRKVHSAPGKLNPMFQEPSVKERPQISHPTFMESTATQACAPLIVTVPPSRPAPQPPSKVSSGSSTSQPEPTTPQPPAKPLPPLYKPQHKAAKPNPPPVPPVKPSPPPAARIKPCTPPLPPVKPQVHRLT
ncbi:zinc metalloproteinase-disintegrin-like MTP8 [Seriola lalandi dorsalis]|uniref:Zinc metalloproteinase-disintegrin-like MTP8 n=1 Tax=Seriola lalandi dorsalis TaxID=1841481 RepID=A0A3B4WH16_SERLL|nr:zinc metalloproteinase-disintegrin-like MTP8 [Seriola lalandi dorsalis]XP_056221816.1 zinc metalloproteinase-disintegrin-like MTP8 [Seriola aureovittata]